MIHGNRKFSVKEYENLDEMCEAITSTTWCLCNSFRYKDLVFFNDSFSEDGAGEYAVYDIRSGKQIESITASWCTAESFKKHVLDLLQQQEKGEFFIIMSTKMPKWDPYKKHHCHLCA